MQILNLIRPEKSDVKYEVIQFPDGEPHIVLNGIDRNVVTQVINKRRSTLPIHIRIGTRRHYLTM